MIVFFSISHRDSNPRLEQQQQQPREGERAVGTCTARQRCSTAETCVVAGTTRSAIWLIESCTAHGVTKAAGRRRFSKHTLQRAPVRPPRLSTELCKSNQYGNRQRQL